MSRTIRDRDPRLYCYDKLENRDKKDPQKSPSYFKKMRERQRKAKIKDAMKHIDIEEINIPKFKKNNDWEWN